MRFPISILASLWIMASGVMMYLGTVSYNKMVAENNNLIETMPLPHGASRMMFTPTPEWTSLFNNLIFPLLLLALVLWLMPTQNRKTPKRA
jgi:hypothetical protein